ncbi:MAG: glycosyltransferase family 4 protein [Thermodesulfobacteriota bacterium]
MRFATAIRHFSRSKGGAERYIIDLCTWLAREGHVVHVYAEVWEDEVPGVHLHRVKTIPFPQSLRLLSFAMRATREIKNGNYDITLGVGNTLEADVLQPHGGVHWAWFWRSLKAYHHPIHGWVKFMGRVLSPKQWVNGYIEDAPYKRTNYKRIVAISEMVKQDIMKWYNIPDEKIDVVYNGVDIERFHPKNHKFREEVRKKFGIGNEMMFLFVSNNFRMKGLHYLVKALGGLKREGSPPFKCLILGRDRKDPYLRLAQKEGVSEDLIFAGSTEEPEKYYGASDLLVHPTFYDACSLTVIEALASGLPVITTRANGAGWILTQGQEGFVISDPRNIQELQKRISHFFNKEERERASISARRLAEAYSYQRNWSEMKAIFEQNCRKEKSTS